MYMLNQTDRLEMTPRSYVQPFLDRQLQAQLKIHNEDTLPPIGMLVRSALRNTGLAALRDFLQDAVNALD